MIILKKTMRILLSVLMVMATVISASSVCLNAHAASSKWVTVLETGGLGYAEENCALFSKPSVLGKVKANIEKGTVLKITGKSGDWYKVEVYPKGDKYTGYLHENVVADGFPVVGTNFRVIATAGLNVRSKMSSSSSKLGALRYNTKVYVIRTSTSGWSQIKYNGKTGYVSTRYLKICL